jgi:tripartite-type tricarboxylate transporter receptor subunit TctC
MIIDNRRSSKYPDAPSAKELGYAIDSAAFGGIYAPKGLPAEVRDRIGRTCAEATRSADLKAFFDRLGNDVVYLDAPAFAARLAADREAKGEAVKALKLQLE